MPSAFELFLLVPFVAGALLPGNASSSNITSISSVRTISRFLWDGEFERIVTWPGFCAKETSVDWGGIEVTLREVWLGEEKRRLQLIYEGGTLSDCYEGRIEGGADDVTELCSTKPRKNHAKDHEEYRDDGTVVRVSAPEDSPPRDVADWFVSADQLRDECFQARNRTRDQALARRGQSRFKRGVVLPDFLFVPGTKWCGPSQLASSYNELGAFDQLDRCCRRHDHCRRAIPPMTQRYAFYNYMPFTVSHCGCDQRGYQALQIGAEDKSREKRRRGRGRGKRDLLLIPGTQWCGRGHRATKYTNLGGFGVADACCRRHDTTCPFFIPAFQTKYNLFNWGVSTLMHCACDERFRTCLKMAGTSSANFVGKLFFNVVQTKCFVLKPEKSCLRRFWRGECELRKQAHLRDNVPY